MEIPYGWTDKIYHGGSALDCRFKSEGGLIAGSIRAQRGSASVTAVDPVNFPMLAPRVEENKPRLLPHRLKWRRLHNAVHWFDLKLAHEANDCKRHHTARILAPQTAWSRWLEGIGTRPKHTGCTKRDSARNLSQVKHIENLSGWCQKLIKDFMKYHKLKSKTIKHERG